MMKKNTREYNLLQIIFPMLLYFVLMRVTAIIIVAVCDMLEIELSGTVRQMICMLVGFAVIFGFFYRRENAEYRIWHEDNLAGDFGVRFDLPAFILAIAVLLLASYSLNNFALLIDLSSYSKSYTEIENKLFSGTFIAELVAYVIISPIAEEMLYRGVVFYRLRRSIGRWSAVIISSVLFSIFHANIVQASYCLLVGFILGIIMEYYQNILVVILGHAAANLLAVLRSEFDLLSLEAVGYPIFLISAIVSIILAGGATVYLALRLKRRLNIIEKKED